MLLDERVQTVSDIKRALPFPVADLEELTDLDPGTFGGEVAGKAMPMLKKQFKSEHATSNVVSLSDVRKR